MPKRFRDGLAKHGETFHYRFWHRGTLYIGNTQCRSLDAAEEWLAGFRDQLALERVGGQRQITFGKLVAEWLEVHKNVHSASHLRGVSNPSTPPVRIRLKAGCFQLQMDTPIEVSSPRKPSSEPASR